jgi:mono/diheme cytochrome c family protein
MILVTLVSATLGTMSCEQPSREELRPDLASSLRTHNTSPMAAVSVTWDETAKNQALADGHAVISKYQCTRCHEIDDNASPARPLFCTNCHQFLKGLDHDSQDWKKLTKKWGDGVMNRYQNNIQHLIDVPNLSGIGKRVRGDWLLTFLNEPFDLRPLVTESMIRHEMTADDIRKVVRYFAAIAKAPDPTSVSYVPPVLPARPSDEQIAEGRRLFADKTCATCHTFGNVDFGVTRAQLESNKALAHLAPNLRFVRDRSRPEALIDWILSPQKFDPKTTMPALPVSLYEAERIADFLYFGDPQVYARQESIEPQNPMILSRKVSYEEMKDRTLGKICVHCHMNDYEKDNGPGNKGGFGFGGDSLAMRTYESLVRGALVEASGTRVSVLVAQPGKSLPLILEVMLRRKMEAPRDQVAPFDDHERPHFPKWDDDDIGMPLGLPAMTDEEITILASWIAQGCEGPEKESGVRGVFDGYLVPDGPIAKNKGCEQREPESKRPEWALETEASAKVH